LLSFGYKNGIPLEADLIFDARFLPNPFFVPRLKRLTGREKGVIQYLRSFPQTKEFVKRVGDLLQYLLPNYLREGKSYLTVAVGCTGGHHRSVFVVEELAKMLKGRKCPCSSPYEKVQQSAGDPMIGIVVTHGHLPELVAAAEMIVEISHIKAVSIDGMMMSMMPGRTAELPRSKAMASCSDRHVWRHPIEYCAFLSRREGGCPDRCESSMIIKTRAERGRYPGVACPYCAGPGTIQHFDGK
jgi:hypothetical protein